MLVSVGCVEPWRAWDDVPGAVLTPTATPDRRAAWTAVVAHDAETWNDALRAIGCSPPFSLGDGGHEIALVERAAWEHDTAVGFTTLDTIVVREDPDGGARSDGTTAHELGHALGLEHADLAYGPSVMIGKGHETQAPNERDTAAAACRLGCGPCDLAADPYAIP